MSRHHQGSCEIGETFPVDDLRKDAVPAHQRQGGTLQQADDVLDTTRSTSRDDLETLLTRYAYLYNHHIPQKALDHRTPIQALQHWQQPQQPELFVKWVAHHPGPDSYPHTDGGWKYGAFSQAVLPGYRTVQWAVQTAL